MRGGKGLSLFFLMLLGVVGCNAGGESDTEEGEPMSAAGSPDLLALNAFYYYADLGRAWDFYARLLGFETVADYGFAKILQVGPNSFLTLVDEARGMHDSSEPKSVTLAVVTAEVEGWWEYLRSEGVEMRAPLGDVAGGRPHDGFVAVDPEGYLLEFERFNPHPENRALIPLLDRTEPLYPVAGLETAPGVESGRPSELGVQGMVLWLYYRDLEKTQAFYRDLFGSEIIVDQGWAKVFPVSGTGFLGFVDGERGLHTATEAKAVTVSFFTEEVEGWFRWAGEVPGFRYRSREISGEGDFVRTFVGYDPEGYYLEWDTFHDVPSNRKLRERIGGGSPASAAENSSDTVLVEMETEEGVILLRLYPGLAPRTVSNFLRYVDAGAYDGGSFHRTVRADNQPDDSVRIAVIQGDLAPGARSAMDAPIPLERTSVTGLHHGDGAVSMARAGPDTATSSFFICVGDQPELDFGGRRNPDGQGFAAFGEVVEGMEVVRAIHAGPAEGQALSPPIRILRAGRRLDSRVR